MDDKQPSVADVLAFESWPEEQQRIAERVLGRKYDRLFFSVRHRDNDRKPVNPREYW